MEPGAERAKSEMSIIDANKDVTTLLFTEAKLEINNSEEEFNAQILWFYNFAAVKLYVLKNI